MKKDKSKMTYSCGNASFSVVLRKVYGKQFGRFYCIATRLTQHLKTAHYLWTFVNRFDTMNGQHVHIPNHNYAISAI